MEFVGIGPEATRQPEIATTTYVFKTSAGEFPLIHFFVPYEVWRADGVNFSNYVWEVGKSYFFSGEVKFLDAAAGSRWYEATRIDKLAPI
jgi:hypothetical protein